MLIWLMSVGTTHSAAARYPVKVLVCSTWKIYTIVTALIHAVVHAKLDAKILTAASVKLRVAARAKSRLEACLSVNVWFHATKFARKLNFQNAKITKRETVCKGVRGHRHCRTTARSESNKNSIVAVKCLAVDHAKFWTKTYTVVSASYRVMGHVKLSVEHSTAVSAKSSVKESAWKLGEQLQRVSRKAIDLGFKIMQIIKFWMTVVSQQDQDLMWRVHLGRLELDSMWNNVIRDIKYKINNCPVRGMVLKKTEITDHSKLPAKHLQAGEELVSL